MNHRKVPILKIPLDNNEDFSKICEIPEFKFLIMNETLKAIKDGVKKKKKQITLFEISDSKHCLNIDKDNWKPSLNSAMEYFVNLDDYNKAIECRDLLKQI